MTHIIDLGVAWSGWLDYFSDPQLLLETLLVKFGPWLLAIVAAMVFIESGILFPMFPGDSLLFTLGLLHHEMELPLWLICVVLLAVAMGGTQIGYWLGKVFGPVLFKPDARVLKTQYLDQAQEFFNKYGGRSVVLARFVPFVRTFVPLAAGMARYNLRKFTLWNVVGASIWVLGFTVAGSLLGGVSWVRNNVEVIALLIVLVSIMPMIVEIGRKYYLRRRAERAGGAGVDAAGVDAAGGAGADSVNSVDSVEKTIAEAD